MTTSEFKKITELLKELTKQLEDEAIEAGVSLSSKEFQLALKEARKRTIGSFGITEQDYNDKKLKVSSFSQEDLMDEFAFVKDEIKELKDTYIPSAEDIEEIAEDVAKRFIKPPEIINKIVKETVVEKPIKETVVVREEYDANPLFAEIGYLEDKINNIKQISFDDLKPELEPLFSENFKKNIDTLGMPNFRKLAMGLQSQIDEVRSNGGGHTIQDEGTPLTARSNLNFVGANVTVTDDAGNDATVVTISGGAGVSDGDKGDITVSGSGATWTIDNGVVSLAKQADVDTSTVFYRKTAGAGSPEVQTLATLKTDLGLTGTNSGDQTSIVGITGTKAQFDTAVTDGNFLYVGDITQYTDEMAQDAVGAMVANSTFVSLAYVDVTPSLTASLSATGTPSVSTFLRGDNTWATPAASGYVTKVGTPVDNQIGVWTGDGTIEGTTALTFNSGLLTVTKTDATGAVNIVAGTGTNSSAIKMSNTGGDFYVGINDSLGNAYGIGDAYDAIFYHTGNQPFLFAPNSTLAFTINANGSATLVGDLTVPDEAYGVGWNGNTEVPTKNAVYDKIETLLPLAGGTLTGNITLGENTSIDLDPAGSADGKYSGICITGTAGAALAFGDLIYLSSVDSRWELADADAASTADRMLGICVLAAAADGNATKILLHGNIRADAAFPALTIGSPVYVGETAGDIQVAIPTGADNIIRRVGYALTADELYFCPSMDSQVTVA